MAEIRAKRIESLFHQALLLEGEARERFLAEACQNEHSLYLEVDSLLHHYQVQDEFLEGTANRSPLLMAFEEEPTFKEGERLGRHYEIIGRLGTGGMGEVFLARDHRLGRKIALKILPRELADQPAFVDRLRREALAASGLNHPNILTIYEFGEHGTLQYIVSEFVEGSSLREHIGQLLIHQALDYASQVGRALAAAHSAGIIHRDIKPENIMVRPDGFIKVLDFGLAKPDNRLSDAGKSLFARLVNAGTTTVPGLLMGTINYMSPEQARGENVDRRTDVWSWGVVLYEMVNGRRPFEAFSKGERQSAGGNPKQLDRLLSRALAKSADDRYQSMDDALVDLARISVRERKLGLYLKQIVSTMFGADSWTLLRRCAVLVLLASALAAGYLVYRHKISAPLRIESRFALTTSGNVIRVAISPDGNCVAYATAEDARHVLQIRTVGTLGEGEPRKLAETKGVYSGVTFARDCQFVYYVVRENERGKLYRLALRGGGPKMVLDDVDSSVSFSPDGGNFAFWRIDSRTYHSFLIVRDMEVGTETILVTLTAPDYFWTAPAWSPDGSSMAFAVLSDSDVGPTNIKLVSIALADKQRHVVGLEAWYSVYKPVWAKGGRSLVFSATANSSNIPQLLEMSWPQGVISAIEPASSQRDLLDIDASADQSRLVGIQYFRRSNPWIVPVAHPFDAQQVPGGDGRFYGIAWTKSGDLISQANIGGHPDLWSIHPVTGELKQLTNDTAVEEDPSASPDDRYLVYASNREGTFHLWRSNADGSDPIRLTADSSREEEGMITPDGQSVVYTSIKSGGYALWRVSMKGGDPIPLTRNPARKASMSPDGAFIVCDYVEKPEDGWKTAILQTTTGKPLRFFPNIPSGDAALPVQWTGDGKNLIFVKTHEGVSNIWMQPIDGGSSKQLTHFERDSIFAFAQSFDGRFLACIRGVATSDAVILQTAK